MKPSETALPGDHSTRRGFLKNTGTVSVALAGVLGVNHSYCVENDPITANAPACGYSQLPEGFIYLNSGTEGSMPDCVISHFHNGLKKWASNPTTSYETDPVFGKRQELNRQAVAQFFGVEKDNVCLTDNTTMGMSLTLMGLNFQPGDKVIVSNHEHNAIKSPLAVQRAKMGLEIVTRAFPTAEKLSDMSSQELLDYLFPNTPALRGARALCVSHVYPTTGVRLPLQALSRKVAELNIQYLVVDGAQAMGMIDLGQGNDHIEHCDFYGGPGHKWLNGPPGTGILYLRNANIRPPEFFPTLSQRMGEYVDKNSSYPMAKALQVRGCSNVPGFAAMIEAMNFQQAVGGPKNTERHIMALSASIKAHIRERSPKALVSPFADASLQSGLSVFFAFNWNRPNELFTDKERADRVVKALLEKNIQIRAIGFDNGGASNQDSTKTYALRVSTAAFNTTEQIAHFKKELAAVLQKLS